MKEFKLSRWDLNEYRRVINGFDDFLVCQKITELLAAYQIDPTRVSVSFFYLPNMIDGEYGISIRTNNENSRAELKILKQLYTDLGIADSDDDDGLILYWRSADLFTKFDDVIGKQNLRQKSVKLSQQVQR